MTWSCWKFSVFVLPCLNTLIKINSPISLYIFDFYLLKQFLIIIVLTLHDTLLYFTDKCEDTIRTLPVLQHSDTNPEDLDTEAEDHAADETRYALMSRPWIPGQSAPKATRLHKNPSEYTINELVAKQTAKRKASEDF